MYQYVIVLATDFFFEYVVYLVAELFWIYFHFQRGIIRYCLYEAVETGGGGREISTDVADCMTCSCEVEMCYATAVLFGTADWCPVGYKSNHVFVHAPSICWAGGTL